MISSGEYQTDTSRASARQWSGYLHFGGVHGKRFRIDGLVVNDHANSALSSLHVNMGVDAIASFGTDHNTRRVGRGASANQCDHQSGQWISRSAYSTATAP